VALIFAEGDDGLEYLRNRVGRRLARAVAAGAVRLVEVPGIDHSMHRVWLRGRVVDAIRAQVPSFLGAERPPEREREAPPRSLLATAAH
jgi:hypothetical protein